jgi:hypothetical protein
VATSPTLPVPVAARLEVPALLRLWHLTSLDAPTVAVVWTLAFAWAAHLTIPAWLVLVVGLSAWAFYISDRLMDARRARTPLRLRHHFHWKHRLVFLPLAVVAGAAALVLVLSNMPPRAEARDSLLAAAAFAYFTGVHSDFRRRLLPKELLVALVFTAACATPALSRASHPGEIVPMLAIYTALAWLNCHAIETWENEAAKTLALAGMGSKIARHAVGLALLGLLAALMAGLFGQPRTALVLAAAALSAGLLGQMDRWRRNFSATALRACADLALLTPLALLAMRG